MSIPPTKNCPDLLIAELIERFERYSTHLETKYYRVDFAGTVAAKIKCCNNEISIEAAIDGGGNTIDIDNINFEETK